MRRSSGGEAERRVTGSALPEWPRPRRPAPPPRSHARQVPPRVPLFAGARRSGLDRAGPRIAPRVGRGPPRTCAAPPRPATARRPPSSSPPGALRGWRPSGLPGVSAWHGEFSRALGSSHRFQIAPSQGRVCFRGVQSRGRAGTCRPGDGSSAGRRAPGVPARLPALGLACGFGASCFTGGESWQRSAKGGEGLFFSTGYKKSC